jgi:nicotinamide phosphoribosyltransferase
MTAIDTLELPPPAFDFTMRKTYEEQFDEIIGYSFDRYTAHRVRFATGTDSYKLSHPEQYPPGTEYVQANITPRTTRVAGLDRAVLFGVQAFLADWCGDAFQDFLDTPEDLAMAAIAYRYASLVGPQPELVERFRALHRLGYLPLLFRGLPEGTVVPLRVPMVTVENTHPEFFWLPNFIESILSSELWHPITSASQARRLRGLLDAWAERTGGAPEFVDFQGHDFSFRGLEGIEAAKKSGAGHLTSFKGSDTLPALDLIDAFYPSAAGKVLNNLIAGSVPATEHAVMCAGGKRDERETYLRLLRTYPAGILSIVSDTWDLWHVATVILPSLKDEIMARDGKLVIRPDSGDPVDIICGDPNAPEGSPANLGLVRLLAAEFGTVTNAKGYLELDPHIGMIYGDSITYDRANEMCARLEALGFASTNIVLGIGSFTYQFVTRDTLGMAMKSTWAQVDGVGRNLFKDPVTDRNADGFSIKKSATGRLAVNRDDDGELYLIEEATPEEEAESLLRPIFCDGTFYATQSFGDIRAVLEAEQVVPELAAA